MHAPPIDPARRDPAAAPPLAFETTQRAGLHLHVTTDYAAALRRLGFDDAAHLRALVRSLEPDPSRRAGRAATRVIETPIGQVLIKRVLKGGVLAPLFGGRVPRFARARDEIDVTAALRARGAPVLEPVVAAGVRQGAGWLALVGTAFVADAVDGATALERAGARDAAAVTALARRCGEAIRRFHDTGARHADLAITNLLVPPGDAPVRVIDLQGARIGAAPSLARRRRELARLARSIARRPAIAGLAKGAWPALEAAYADSIAASDD